MDSIIQISDFEASVALKLAREIERARLEAELTTEELLQGLRKQRERYYREENMPDA